MATSEEKKELVDALSGPRYYRVLIQGYGGESAYMSISKEAHDFWKEVTEEHGDSDLVSYMLSSEDADYEFENISEVPLNAQFLYDAENDSHCPWYESHTEYEHVHGAAYDQAYIDIDEVADDEYNSDHIAEVVSREDVSDFNSRIGEETDWEVEIIEMGTSFASEDIEYIAQMYSSEKGCFFEGVIETVGEFDPKKLKIYTTEYDNGEDTITSVEYDGVEVENSGGDTNGKGYYASVWKNES